MPPTRCPLGDHRLAILDSGGLIVRGSMVLPGLPSTDILLALGAAVALGGAYLVVVPLALYWWMNRRWMVMGKLERTGIYGLVFLFFPGLILFSPFLNLRLAGQGKA